MIVYILKNNNNGKIYIGKTKYNLDSYLRWNINAAVAGKTGKRLLWRAIRKHGAGAFTIHPLIVQIKNNDIASELEKKFIRLFDAQNPDKGYNLCSGGEGVSGLTEDQRKAISIRMRGNKHGAGTKHSEASIAQFRSKVVGQKRDFIPWNKGLTKTDDPRIKTPTNAFKLGHVPSSETIEKRVSKLRGRKRPDVSERMINNNPRKKIE